MTKAFVRFAVLGWFAGCALAAQNDGLMVLTRKPMNPGGPNYLGAAVEFLDVSTPDQLVHFDGAGPLPLRVRIRYKVVKPAPVVLSSSMGTEYWRLYNYQRGKTSALHTRERIDLSKPGEARAEANSARVALAYGAALTKGLCGLRGHYYFLVEQPDGRWLGVEYAPPFFDRPDLAQRCLFTLANLNAFSLSCAEVESTWRPGGPIRVRFTVTDADGEIFPVLPASAEVSAGAWSAAMRPQQTLLHLPTGWMIAELPKDAAPAEARVRGVVNVMTPNGPVTRRVEAVFAKGQGQKTAADILPKTKATAMPLRLRGRVFETRALWVAMKDLYTKADIEKVVRRAAQARLNVLLPCVFVRSALILKSPLWPMTDRVEKGLDPLAYLIAQAHRRGVEVHPWFCVTYRDKAFRAKLGGVDVVQKNGKPHPTAADVHRPKYRDFIVNLMVGVARDYDVDGVHLDYIRAMSRCYCPACRREFAEKFGHPLEQATDQEWLAWQRGAVGDIVRRVAEGVRRVRPRSKISAAVFSNMRSGALQGQDPAGWARKGWLDLVIPMDYQMQTLVVKETEQKFLDALDDDTQLVTGLSLYQRAAGKAVTRPPALTQEQITLVRLMGVRGYCLFVSVYLNDDMLKMLREQVNREPATPFFRAPERIRLRERCVGVLRGALRSEEFWPSMHAAEALTQAGYGRVVLDALRDRLQSEKDDRQRCGLAREQVRAGRRKLASVMLSILADKKSPGRVHAAESLYKVGEIGDGKLLRAALDEGNPALEMMAAAALAKRGDKAALARVRRYLKTGDMNQRRIAAWVLGRLGDRRDWPELRRLASEGSTPLIRSFAVNALAQLGAPGALEQVARNLKSPDAQVRTYAAQTVGDCRAASLLNALKPLLNDPHLDARIRAAQAILRVTAERG